MTLNFGNNLFPPRNELSINYDWVDVADGTGAITFDAYSTSDKDGVKNKLIRSVNASNIKSITGYDSNGYDSYNINVVRMTVTDVLTKHLDVEFSLEEFALPKIIKGKGYVNFSYIIGGISNIVYSYFIVKLVKLSGVVETEICTAQTSTTTIYGQTKSNSMELDIPQTSFKKGDILKLVFEGYTQKTSSGGVTDIDLGIAGDPSNEAGVSEHLNMDAGKTRIVLIVPFKLDI